MKYSFELKVKDSNCQSAYKVFYLELTEQLQIITQKIKEAITGKPYEMTLIPSGGYGTYKWSIHKNCPLNNLFINQEALLYGTPHQESSCYISIALEDSKGTTNDADNTTVYKEYIFKAVKPLELITQQLPEASKDSYYSEKIMVEGGLLPLNFKTLDSLPSELSIDKEDGVIYGVPNQAGRTRVRISIKDSSESSGQKPIIKEFEIAVIETLNIITSSILPPAIKGHNISNIFFEVNKDKSNCIFSVINDELPPGIILDSKTGQLYGTPEESRDYLFKILVKSGEESIEKTMFWKIYDNLKINPINLPEARQNRFFYYTFSAEGGLKPYSWNIIGHSLPDGLKLNCQTGTISGIPLAASDYMTYSIEVIDSENDNAFQKLAKSFKFGVQAHVELSITPKLSNGMPGKYYYDKIEAKLIETPYIWNIDENKIPDGLQLECFSDTCIIKGIPKNTGQFIFNVEVIDSGFYTSSVSRDYSITIRDNLIINDEDLDEAVKNSDYNEEISIFGGLPPYKLEIIQGNLPEGLGIRVDYNKAVIYGNISKSAQTSEFKIRVKDSESISYCDKSFIIYVKDDPPAITTTEIKETTAKGEYYYNIIKAKGGNLPYNFKICQGDLPEGIILKKDDDTGEWAISGTTSDCNLFDFTICLEDFSFPKNIVSHSYKLDVICPESDEFLSPDTAIAAGEKHILALKDNGTVWAWGKNTSGQLGDGSFEDKDYPVQIPNLLKIKAIAAGKYHSIALQDNGTVWAWGNNNFGQLGDGTNNDKNLPVEIVNLYNIKQISCGAFHSIALDNDGNVWTWGRNSSGQSGNEDNNTNNNSPVLVDSLKNKEIKSIEAGANHCFAITVDENLMAWGNNSYGQLGDGTNINRNYPVSISLPFNNGFNKILSISAGEFHTLAVTNDGKLWAWGSNKFRQLGNGTTNNHNEPVLISNISGIKSVASGKNHSLALINDGTVLAWGDNRSNQVDGNNVQILEPKLLNISNISSIDAGSDYSIALKKDSSIWAWGSHKFLQTDYLKLPEQIYNFKLNSIISILPVGDLTINEDQSANDQIFINIYDEKILKQNLKLSYIVKNHDLVNNIKLQESSDNLYINIVSESNKFGETEILLSIGNGKYSTTEIFNLSILEVNDPPIANSQDISLDEDNISNIVLSGSDIDNNKIEYKICKEPEHGTYSIQGDALKYSPNSNYFGTDYIGFKAFDGYLYSNESGIRIKINPVDDPPFVDNPIKDIIVDKNSSDIEIKLSNVFSDVDNNDNLISKEILSYSNNSLLIAKIENNFLKIKFNENQYGNSEIKIKGISNNKETIDSFFVKVNDILDKVHLLSFTSKSDDSYTFITNSKKFHFSGTKEKYSMVIINNETIINENNFSYLHSTWNSNPLLNEGYNLFVIKTKNLSDIESKPVTATVYLDTQSPTAKCTILNLDDLTPIDNQSESNFYTTTLLISISGEDVSHYQYSLDNNECSSEISVHENIILTNLESNRQGKEHVLKVKARDLAGNWQEKPTELKWSNFVESVSINYSVIPDKKHDNKYIIMKNEPIAFDIIIQGGKGPFSYSYTCSQQEFCKELDLNYEDVYSRNVRLYGNFYKPGEFSLEIKVTDEDEYSNNESGIISITLLVLDELKINTPPILPVGTQGKYYAPVSISASGGSEDAENDKYKFYINSDSSDILNFVTILENGILSINTAKAGSYTFSINVVDNYNYNSSEKFSVLIRKPLKIENLRISDGIINHDYNTQFIASGGSLQYTWSIAGGNPVSGLNLNAKNGEYQGIPIETYDGYLNISVTDSEGRRANNSYKLKIAEPLKFVTQNLPAFIKEEPYHESIIVEGGIPDYNFRCNGTLPKHIQLAPDTGILSGITESDNSVYTISINVTDSFYNDKNQKSHNVITKNFPVTYKKGFVITSPSNIPEIIENRNYNNAFQLLASGGQPPYTWSVIDACLPYGIILDKDTGILSGKPNDNGDFSFIIQAMDAEGKTDTKTFNWNITEEFKITTKGIPNCAKDEFYSFVLKARGGKTPYTWNIIEGKLPDGLELVSNKGIIQGTPTENDLGYIDPKFTVEVLSSDNQFARADFSIELIEELFITPDKLHDARVGKDYHMELKGLNGEKPYSWTHIDGIIPPCFELRKTPDLLYIEGKALTPNEYNFSISLDDINGFGPVEKSYTLNVYDDVKISPIVIPTAIRSNKYSIMLTAFQGKPPYKWRIKKGSLPKGLELFSDSDNLYISGIVSKDARSAELVIKVEDDNNSYDELSTTIGVFDELNLDIDECGIHAARQYHLYQAGFKIDGGKPPYKWEISGDIPEGLTFNNDMTGINAYLSGSPEESGNFKFYVKVTDSSVISDDNKGLCEKIRSFELPVMTYDKNNDNTPPVIEPVEKGFISGKVIAEGFENEVLNAFVFINDKIGTFTDENGNYEFNNFNLQPGLYDIFFNLTGYCDLKSNFYISSAQNLTHNVDLFKSDGSQFKFETDNLTCAFYGENYNAEIKAVGGCRPFTYTILNDSLPKGLTFNRENGLISGTPEFDDQNGTIELNVQVVDSNGHSIYKLFELNIAERLECITDTKLKCGVSNSLYKNSIDVNNGISPFSYNIYKGTFPEGLTISHDGIISGKANPGMYIFSMKIEDKCQYIEKDFELKIEDPLEITTESLNDGIVGEIYTVSLQSKGGCGEKIWAVTNGCSLDKFNIDTKSGEIFGRPDKEIYCTYTFRVTDSSGNSTNKSYKLNIADKLEIITTIMPSGLVDKDYSKNIEIHGGKPPYIFQSKNPLPEGLKLNSSTGEIYGKPCRASLSSIEITVTDSSNPVQECRQKIQVPINRHIAITTQSLLPDVCFGDDISNENISFAAIGGILPLSWEIIDGGLPKGVKLDSSNGLLSGIAGDSGVFSFTIKVTDSNNMSDTAQIRWNIYDRLKIDTNILKDAIELRFYNFELKASGGLAPYSWVILSGDYSFPQGLILDHTGIISGTPQQKQESRKYTFEVKDSDNNKYSKCLNLTVLPTNNKSITKSIPDGMIGVYYSERIDVNLAYPPYKWDLIQGSLPAGLIINYHSDYCVIKGYPKEVQDYNFTIEISDSGTPIESISKQYSITINKKLEIERKTLDEASKGKYYSESINVNGVPPYIWSIENDIIPEGLEYTFINNQLLIYGTVDESAKSSEFIFKVCNPEFNISDQQSFPIFVKEDPELIFITTDIDSAAQNREYSSYIKAEGGIWPYTFSIAKKNLPDGLILDKSGKISGTPTGCGKYDFIINLTDSSSNSRPKSRAFIFEVKCEIDFPVPEPNPEPEPNPGPEVSIVISKIENQRIDEDTPFYDINFTVENINNSVDEIILNAKALNKTLIKKVEIINESTDKPFLRIYPEYEQTGETVILISASNGQYTANRYFMLYVDEVNDPPAAQSKTIEINEEESIQINLLATDIDSPDIFYIIEKPTINENFSLNNNIYSYTPCIDFYGSDSLIYYASDGISKSEPANITIIVNNIDDPPFVKNPVDDITVDEDSQYIEKNLKDVFSDIDNNESEIRKSIYLNNNPELVSSSINGNTLKLEFHQNKNGQAKIFLMAVSNNLSITHAFNITVKPINDPPVIGDIEDQIIMYNDKLKPVSFYAADFESKIDELIISKSSSNPELIPVENIAFNNAGSISKSFQITPQTDQHGIAIITITVSDGLLSNSESFTVTVNDPPIACAGEDQEVYEEEIVDLNASGSKDKFGGIYKYEWVQTSGPYVIINNSNEQFASFMAPELQINETELEFELTVYEKNQNLYDKDSCTVIVKKFDNTPPFIKFAGGMHNDIVPKKNKQWSWSGLDDTEPVSFCAKIDQKPLTSMIDCHFSEETTSAYLDGNDINDGTYYLNIQAEDGAGNLSKIYSVFVYIDNTPPEIIKLKDYYKKEKNEYYFQTNRYEFILYGTKDKNSLVYLEDQIIVDENSKEFSELSWQYRCLLKEGNNQFVFNSKDIAGNISSETTANIFLDTKPLVADYQILVPDKYIHTSDSEIIFYTPDVQFLIKGKDISYYKYALDDNNFSEEYDYFTNEILSLNLTQSKAGIFHSLKIKARDNAGNWQKEPTVISWKNITYPLRIIDIPFSKNIVEKNYVVMKDDVCNVKIKIEGGMAPFDFSIDSGKLPDGLSLTNKGDYAIIEGKFNKVLNTVFTVKVSDKENSFAKLDFKVWVLDKLKITNTSPLLSATVGKYYNPIFFKANGGANSNYIFNFEPVNPDIDFDKIISITEQGKLNVTPERAGEFNFNLNVSDPFGYTDSKYFKLSIRDTLQITTEKLNDCIIKKEYKFQMNAVGGTGNYKWKMKTGNLINNLGLGLNPENGILSGFSEKSFYGSVIISVSDDENRFCEKEYFLRIAEPLHFITEELPVFLKDKIYIEQIKVTGGVPAYHYKYIGNFPKGLYFDKNTGVLAGKIDLSVLSSEYSFDISVSDNCFNEKNEIKKTFKIIIVEPLSIKTITLLNDAIEKRKIDDLFKFEAVGGKLPYTWSLVKSNLPEGISLDNSSGKLSGIPKNGGFYNFSIQVCDAQGNSVTKNISWNIIHKLKIITQDIPNGAINNDYICLLEKTGGIYPFKWKLAGNDKLPDGLNLNPYTGKIYGKPSGDNSSWFESKFTIEVSDSSNPCQCDSQEYYIEITGNLALLTKKLKDGLIDKNYQTEIIGANGKKPYSCKLEGNNLPDGLQLLNTDTGAIIKGTPLKTGPFNFSIKLNDSSKSNPATKEYTINIYDNVKINDTVLQTATPGKNYSQPIYISCGKRPYEWKISKGALPCGLELIENSNVLYISGTVNEHAKGGDFDISVYDDFGSYDSISLTIKVANPVTIVENIDSDNKNPKSAYQNRLYKYDFFAVNGIKPYKWSIQGETPKGLIFDKEKASLNGIPEQCGGFSFGVGVQDSSIPQDSYLKQFKLEILCQDDIYDSDESYDYGSISGRIYNNDNNIGISNVRVYLNNELITFSDPMGNYEIKNLNPGLYDIRFENENHCEQTIMQYIPKGEKIDYDIKFYSTDGSELNIVNSELKCAVINEEYNEQIEVKGGCRPYLFSLCEGNSLPENFTLSDSGLINGKAINTGKIDFCINVSDSSGDNTDETISINFVKALEIENSSELNCTIKGKFLSHQIEVKNGIAPYTYLITSGKLPDGLTLSDKGIISGIPLSSNNYHFVINIKDSNCSNLNQDFYVKINDPLEIITYDLIDGITGKEYNYFIDTNNGGCGEKIWSIKNNCKLHDIFINEKTGQLYGIPEHDFSCPLIITVHDSYGNSSSMDYIINIAKKLKVISTSMPAGIAGYDYKENITIEGGIKPYNIETTSDLPKGLFFNPETALIYGKSERAGGYNFELIISDSSSSEKQTIEQYIYLPINSYLTIVTPSIIAPLKKNIDISDRNFYFTAKGGTSQYEWNIIDGFLPPGIELDSGTGKLEGFSTEHGDYIFTVKVIDSNKDVAAKQFILQIYDTLKILTPGLYSATVNKPYNLILNASGGLKPYTWRIHTSLPQGLTFNSETGIITGIPLNEQGYQYYTIEVTDNNNPFQSYQKEFLFSVVSDENASLYISPSIADAMTGSYYYEIIEADLGCPPYRWKVETEKLPKGLTCFCKSNFCEVKGIPYQLNEGKPFFFNVEVSDSSVRTKRISRDYSITVKDELEILDDLPDVDKDKEYQGIIYAKGGSQSYSWKVINGKLPEGLYFDYSNSLLIKGQITDKAQSSRFKVQVMDTQFKKILEKEFIIYVNNDPKPIITTLELDKALQYSFYSIPINARGGLNPYRWNFYTGILPNGIDFYNSTAEINGTPTSCGLYNFTIKLCDNTSPWPKQTLMTYVLDVQCIDNDDSAPLLSNNYITSIPVKSFNAGLVEISFGSFNKSSNTACGYGFIWDSYKDTTAPEIVMTKNTNFEFELNNGMNNYFHIRPINCSGLGGDTIHIGPFYVNKQMIPCDLDYSDEIDLSDAIIALQISCGFKFFDKKINYDAYINNDKEIGIDEIIYILHSLIKTEKPDIINQ